MNKKISLAAVMAILASVGYGGYTLIKEKDLEALRSGNVALYKVVRVIDGDTFEIGDTSASSVQATSTDSTSSRQTDSVRTREGVRLLGIDAPDEGECYYDESKEALRKMVEDKEVELRKDVTNADDFGRLLRYAILPSTLPLGNNILVDEEMVRLGFADVRSNPRDKLYYGVLLEAREKAVKEKKGMWGKCDFTPSEHSQADVPAPSAQCSIKGNVSAGEFGKTYFLPACNNYEQVKVDPDRGEEYFCSEKEAKEAGFVRARYCP